MMFKKNNYNSGDFLQIVNVVWYLGVGLAFLIAFFFKNKKISGILLC